MTDTYAILAKVYRQAGFTTASERLRARLFSKIQSEGWLGRHILELGCGVGETSCWFSENGFRIRGVDQSEAMLAEARQLAQARGLGVNWQQADIRNLEVSGDHDLVLCMNTLNEMRSVPELETVFQLANRALAKGKILLFDLVTIQGLAEQWGNRDHVLYDDPDALTVVVRSRFSFETSVNTRAYFIYIREGDLWRRDDETHVLRGYTLKAVGTLLQRTGFQVQEVVDANLNVFDPYDDQTGRAVFIAAKQ